MPDADDRIAPLLPRRILQLERRMAALEKRLDATVDRLELAVDVAIRITRLVAVLNTNIRTTHRRHRRRMDRLAETVVSGRTADAERLTQLARRLAALDRP